MADFTALKTAIQNAIKQNGNEEITGAILQEVMLAVVNTLGDSAINDLISALANEVTNRQNADGTLQTNITNEAAARGNADTALGTRIDNEVTARENADTALSNRITAITDAIDNGYVYAGIATTSTEPATGKVFYLTTATGVFTNFGGITVNTKGIKILKKEGSTWASDTVIVMDDTPTENSTNLVKSGGVYASIASVLSKIAEGYLYMGIATAATNPSTPTTKVFYIAVAAGTYTNFLDSGSAALVLTQGINILKYNGTSWSVEQVWGVDDNPTSGSNNLVKSGGVFNDIMTNGSAFDLSAYNNGTTYADLNAALTALNALPAAYKRGGMSLKFVLTSDNKYVQWRLMANTFTTDVTLWQGVDVTPTIGSKNLVESGGVYNSAVFRIDDTTLTKDFSCNSGNTVATPASKIDIPLKAGDKIHLSVTTTGISDKNYTIRNSSGDDIGAVSVNGEVEIELENATDFIYLYLNKVQVTSDISVHMEVSHTGIEARLEEESQINQTQDTQIDHINDEIDGDYEENILTCTAGTSVNKDTDGNHLAINIPANTEFYVLAIFNTSYITATPTLLLNNGQGRNFVTADATPQDNGVLMKYISTAQLNIAGLQISGNKITSNTNITLRVYKTKGLKKDIEKLKDYDEELTNIIDNNEVQNNLLSSVCSGETRQVVAKTGVKVSSVTHYNGNIVIRTDSFTYATNSITEVRQLSTSEKLIVVTNLTTLESTLTWEL